MNAAAVTQQRATVVAAADKFSREVQMQISRQQEEQQQQVNAAAAVKQQAATVVAAADGFSREMQICQQII